MLNNLKKLLAYLIASYCRYSPMEKCKWRLQTLGFSILNNNRIITKTLFKTKMQLTFPDDYDGIHIFFRGTYEDQTSRVFLKMLHKDMVFFDVGANMGWYSMLASVNGENITCHAFEPAPFIFQKLKNNAIINNVTDRVLLNNIAIGNSNTIVDLYTFKGLPHGHSSLSSQGRKEYSISTVKMTTLDSYISSNNISKVDFIKLDVEGAELNVVKGALSVFRHNPSWLIELNNHTASQFNYAPADILDAICKNGDYILYKIINGQDRLARLKHINDYGNGDNVFCIHRSNLQKLQVLDRLCK